MAPHANDSNGEATGMTAPMPSAIATNGFTVNSPNVNYTDSEITSKYTYRTTDVSIADGRFTATPKETVYDFKTERKVGKVGLMMVGLGGNNGTTVTAGILANRRKLTWDTREGPREANYYGSVTMSSTVKLGSDSKSGKDVNIPLQSLLPMVHPNDLVIGGWDISGMDLAAAADRAKVLEPALKGLVRKELAAIKPLPSVYYPDFIAANQGERADNVLEGSKACNEHVERLRQDIRDFKAANSLDRVIVLWTANTERYAEIIPGVNDTADNLIKAIADGHEEVSPSTVFAVACILENAPFINGSPQNTFVPGCIQFAEKHNAFIGGDDFKSGQTKMKSALVDFMINAGIKLTSIASYNHLGNNDGMNLSSQKQFRSKEISKSNVVDDMVAANSVLYKEGEHPDHTVVIKYMPAVGDNKRALDEYYAEVSVVPDPSRLSRSRSF
nr:inositol-3-phosphate synthase [Quercus suber]